MPMWAQIMFFGALLSAILSTASGALLAPSALFSENVLRPFVPHLSDRQLLMNTRLILLVFTAGALLFALNSTSTMYEMVQNAYNVTLAGAFVPLVAGAYWKRATTQGALLSIVLGIGTWLAANTVAPEAMVPPNLVGFFASLIGMALGSLAPQLITNRGQSIAQATAHPHAAHHGNRPHGGSGHGSGPGPLGG
jgi:Na+/proline symporter